VTRWPSAGGGGNNWSPGLLDRAETFAESDVSVSQTRAVVESGSIELGQDPEEVISDSYVVDDDDSQTTTVHDTFSVTFTEYDEELEFWYDVNLSDNDTVGWGLYDATLGEMVAFEDKSADFSSTKFIDVSGYAGETHDYELRSDNGVIYEASHNVDTSVTRLKKATDGSATITWPMPEDVAGWDIIPFQPVENGGTVEVYAVDPSNGTQLAGPLDDPGDISGLSRSTNVAVEVVLERSSPSENPRLEAVYRRRKIT